LGHYCYHATKKRAVIAAGSHSYGYDANGNMTSRDGSTIGYTSYNLPGVINAGSNSSTIYYGAYRNRYKQTAVTAGVTETTIYIGGILEKVTRSGVTEYRHRIEGGNGTAAIYVRRSSGSPATETYFVHRDQLGSPELITNSAGAVVVRLSFGAYGERRDSDWDGAVSSADMTAIGNTTRRGFTGHEHLDAVGLVHMNGRVYEPVIGRMLAPDAVVQIGAAQSVNCYAYVWNNPLTRTDPSGWVADNEVSPPWPLPEVPVTGQRIIPDTFASRMAALSLWQPSFGGDPVLRGGGGGGANGQGQQSEPCAPNGTIAGFLAQHGAEVVDRALSIVGGAGQMALGGAICSGVATCAGGAILAAHGASNLYEGATGTSSLLREGYDAVLGSAGEIAYSLVDIGTSVYGLTRSVVKPGTWKLFRNISSDYVPAFKTMTGAELITEGAGLVNDGLGAAGVPLRRCEKQ
jgi:RHS repeat-associated protein